MSIFYGKGSVVQFLYLIFVRNSDNYNWTKGVTQSQEYKDVSFK